MDHEPLVILTLIAADILRRGASVIYGPRDKRDIFVHRSISRERLDDLPREHFLLIDILSVHNRRSPGDRDRLLECPDIEVGIHVCREPCRQLDTLPLKRAEAGQRERDCVNPGPQIHKLVLSLVVGDDGADLFDQRRTGRFHCDARQDCSRRVSHRPPDAATRQTLRAPRDRQQHETQREPETPEEVSVHGSLRSRHRSPPQHPVRPPYRDDGRSSLIAATRQTPGRRHRMPTAVIDPGSPAKRSAIRSPCLGRRPRHGAGSVPTVTASSRSCSRQTGSRAFGRRGSAPMSSTCSCAQVGGRLSVVIRRGSGCGAAQFARGLPPRRAGI